MKHDDNANLAVGGSRKHILNSRSYLPSKLFCFGRDESITGYQPAILMGKKFQRRQKIDEIIQRAFEGGLFFKWEKDTQRKRKRPERLEASFVLNFYQLRTFISAIIGGGVRRYMTNNYVLL